MKHIPISEFKATCAEVMDDVAKTKATVVITKHGKPVAEISPARPARPKKSWIGSLEGQFEIVGDIVGPSGALDDADSLKEWDELNRK